MECYICKALEEKGKWDINGSWTSLEIIKENDGHYCNALGEGKASMPINFCPNCGCQLEDYKALKVLRLDDVEKIECLYPSIPIYKDDNEELKKAVERRINAIKNRLRCAVCDGVGLTSMGAGIRGMVTCQACHGTGLMDEPIAHTIKKYQEDIKELEEYVEYWQKECDRRQEKIDKTIEKLTEGIEFCEKDSQGLYNMCNIAIHREKEILKTLKGEED